MSKLIIPMSSSGYCPRALTAKFIGVKGKAFPKWLETAAEEGNLHEDAIKAKLRSEGYIIQDDRNECLICKEEYGSGRKGIHVEIEMDKYKLVGHMDGLVTGVVNELSMNHILECKSMSQNEYWRWAKGGFDEFPQYAAQITCYMIAMDLYQAMYVVKNRNNGFTERNMLNNLQSDWAELCYKLDHVAECVENKQLAEAEYKPETIECQRCVYSEFCVPTPVIVGPKRLEEVMNALNNRAALKEHITELDKDVKFQEEIIKSYLRETGLKQRKFGYVLSLSEGCTTTTYPKNNLIAAGVTDDTLREAARVGEPYDRLYVKNLDKED